MGPISTPLRLMRSAVVLPRLEPLRTYAHGERSPFVRGKEERNLRLTLDLDSLSPCDSLDLLLEFGRHEAIDVTTTKPAGFSTISVGTTVASGDSVDVRTEHPNGSGSISGVWPGSQWVSFAEQHARSTRSDGAETRRRFLLAGAVAGETDALVLRDSSFVHNVGRNANPLSAEDAAALTGLFLRSRNHSEVAMWEHGRERSSLGSQYFVVARTILPAAWRWWSACVSADQSSSRRQTMGTAEAVISRFPRCIRARDEVMYRCLVPIGQSDQEAMLYHLDALLLMLSGTLDSTALVANDAHSIGFEPWDVGWRRKRWRKALRSAAPRLHALTERGALVREVIDLVAAARNTIHGEPLGGVRYHGAGVQMHLVRLPARAAPKIVQHAEILGGTSHWGIRPPSGDITLLDPLHFVQIILPFAAAALNAIMETTEVELLSGVNPSDLLVEPPTSGLFEPPRVRRLQLLLGLAS